MACVDLGFLQKCDSWKLNCRFFPSKVGGQPAWLSLKHLPTVNDLSCKKCQKVMIFLCQIYAPYADEEINSEIWLNNFHRTIFIFICRNSECNENNNNDNIVVFRSNLRRDNEFYDYVPSELIETTYFDITKWTNICRLCGITAVKRCAKCKHVFYCCKEHQIIDWKSGHKVNCSSAEFIPYTSPLLFPEWELISHIEEIDDDFDESDEDEGTELETYNELKVADQVGTLNNISEMELNKFALSEEDTTFMEFTKIVSCYSDQVFRYSRNGEPLFIAKEPKPNNIPNCELCGGERQFEFQIMPQLLLSLECDELDWGVLLIYTCKNSCSGDSLDSYKKEYVFKQDVTP